MLVKGYFVTLVAFRPPLPEGECASCGAMSDTYVEIGLLLKAPYCRTCAERAGFRKRFILRSLAIVALGLVVILPPVYMDGIPLIVSFVVPPLIVAAGLLAYAIMRERRLPEGSATTAQDAVRLLRLSPPFFFCSNRRFMERLVDMHGGTAVPGAQRQWDVAWSAIPAAALVLGLVWLVLVVSNNGAVMVDHGGSARAIVWVDGERAIELEPGEREKLHLRPGHHTFGWSPTDEKPTVAREWRVEALHDYLYDPGATTCYWRSVTVYERRGPAHARRPELDGDGPLPIDEVYDFRHVDQWFSANPTEKRLSNGEAYSSEVAILRDAECSKLVAAGCSKSVLDELVLCESKAPTNDDINACVAKAASSCK